LGWMNALPAQKANNPAALPLNQSAMTGHLQQNRPTRPKSWVVKDDN